MLDLVGNHEDRLFCVVAHKINACYFRSVEMNTKRGTVELSNPKAGAQDIKKNFTFDTVYDWK